MNLDYAIDFASKDEMGELARSLNQMTKQLKAANEANQEAVFTLERKVAEKSEELKRVKPIFSWWKRSPLWGNFLP